MKTLYALISFVWLGTTAFAQRDLTEIPEPDIAAELASFTVADGFEVNLFAADPQLAAPIQMNFDPQGRLWVATSEVYPQIKPGQEANDKILVLEDTDQDGVADQTTVFAEGLLIPTGVEPGHGGAYVANSTEIVHIADTNGDGRGDKTRVILSGFGTEDTHHIVHTFRWGMDGRLYFNQSIYIHSHIETPYGVRRLGGGGIWRFDPDAMKLDVFARGFINPWGHHFDSYGQSFATDGAGGEGINYVVPGAYYRTAVGAARILPGLNPGSPKYCGLEILSGRHLPDDWRGDMITNDFRGHRVCRFKIQENGSGYAAYEQQELLKTNRVTFRPVDVKMGPDGAIYVADWYNPIIQHGEVDFRDPRRDHAHGRIWRITRKDRDLVSRPNLVTASAEELLQHLKSPEDWTRHNARRVICDRQHTALHNQTYDTFQQKWSEQLGQVVALEGTTDNSDEQYLLELLWTAQALRIDLADNVRNLMISANDARVRAAAVRIAADEAEEFREELTQAIDDQHPRVRLEAVRALQLVEDPAIVTVATNVLNQHMDPFLDYGLWLLLHERKAEWLPLVAQGKLTFGGQFFHTLFAAESVNSPVMVSLLLKQLEQASTSAITPDHKSRALTYVARFGDPSQLRQVFEMALAANTERSLRVGLLHALAQAASARQSKPVGDLSPIVELLDETSAPLQLAALQCIGAWKLQAATPEVTQYLSKREGRQPEAIIAALRALTLLDQTAARSEMLSQIDDTDNVSLKVQLLSLLVSNAPRKAAEEAVKFLKTNSAGETDVAPLFEAFVARKSAVGLLVQALDQQSIHADAAKIGLRVASSSGQKFPELEAALQQAGGVGSGPVILSEAEMNRLVKLARSQGDPRRGEAIYRRGELTCMKCHAIGGAGGLVGPDLTSLGGSAQIDYLIESLLNPNAKVKENYHSVVLITDAGKAYSGIKIGSSNEEIVLRDANGKEFSVPAGEVIDESVGTSLMPAGLTEKLTESEFVDLVRFLSALGKDDAFRVGREPLARTWQFINKTPQAEYRLRRTRHASTATNDPAYTWSSTYSTVSGALPLRELPVLGIRRKSAQGTDGFSFVRTFIDVKQPGEFNFTLNDSTGLEMWLDGQPVTLDAQPSAKLDVGKHQVTLSIDRSQRTGEIALRVSPKANSTGQVAIVFGP